jgi:predicted ester cyclase
LFGDDVPTIPSVLLDYIQGLAAHDIERVANTVANDLRFVAATRVLDKPQFLAMLRALYTGFPDWHYEHDPIEARSDCYAVKWRQGGTHTGTWNLPGMDPIAPTGKPVRIPEHYFFYKIAGDRIVEIHPDPIPGGAPRGILQQIGVEAPPL